MKRAFTREAGWPAMLVGARRGMIGGRRRHRLGRKEASEAESGCGNEKNAREGIETSEPCRYAFRSGSRGNAKNAREGIETPRTRSGSCRSARVETRRMPVRALRHQEGLFTAWHSSPL